MKKGLLSLLLVCSLWVQAQTDTTEIEFATPSDSTAIGAPDGKSAATEIGPSGGKIASEDGRVELIFPAGALTETKMINIQPTTNHAPNGAGKSYWFEPSGIQFKKPVQIIFHYSDEDAEACPPDFMCWGIQSKTGKWSFVEYDDQDTISKTLKGFIRHFSGGSNVYKLKLECSKTQLRVKESARIRINKHYAMSDAEIIMERTVTAGAPVIWFVNRIEMGNQTVGYISAGETMTKATRQSTHRATYTAPDHLIRKNPVTVSVDLYVSSGKKKVYKRATTLSCKIDIYDVYQVTVNFTAEFPGANGTELTDSSTFFVWVYPERIVIDNIKNYTPYLSKVPKKSQCNIIIFTEGHNGHVHLKDGYRNYKLSNDDPPEVYFQFLPMYETGILKFQWICHKVPPSPVETLHAIPISPEINFIANGQTQRINVTRYGVEYKTVIVPYRPAIPH